MVSASFKTADIVMTDRHRPHIRERCEALMKAFDGDVDRVLLPGSRGYAASTGSYYSQQACALQPACVVAPSCTEDVSVALSALFRYIKEGADPQCMFAVRSGGYAASAGAASIQDGVVIDLSKLDFVRVSADRKSAEIGPGAMWGSVYKVLDPLGLTVAGGRAAEVGVGGLTTGGGLSYISTLAGFTCDTVESFEIVLADGRVESANANENSDLWVALRGGSGNFGIVTSFSFITFEHANIWGGMVFSDLSTVPRQLKAFLNFTTDHQYDEFSSLILSFGYAEGLGSAVTTSIEYMKPVENPLAFQPFTAIPNLMSSLRITSLSDILVETQSMQPRGRRQFVSTLTFAPGAPILQACYDRWQSAVDTVREMPGVFLSLTLEPLPPAITAKSRLRGGNAMGLGPDDGDLVVCLLMVQWSNAADDEVLERTGRRLLDELYADTTRFGVANKYVFLNYAAPHQDPIASYGEGNVMRMREASRKYDPEGVFQKHVPGGFKIPGL